MKTIVVTKTAGGNYQATLKELSSGIGLWADGESPDSAIVRLIKAHLRIFEVKVELPTEEKTGEISREKRR